MIPACVVAVWFFLGMIGYHIFSHKVGIDGDTGPDDGKYVWLSLLGPLFLIGVVGFIVYEALNPND